jgi:hypothetical protein
LLWAAINTDELEVVSTFDGTWLVLLQEELGVWSNWDFCEATKSQLLCPEEAV